MQRICTPLRVRPRPLVGANLNARIHGDPSESARMVSIGLLAVKEIFLIVFPQLFGQSLSGASHLAMIRSQRSKRGGHELSAHGTNGAEGLGGRARQLDSLSR